jgi:hypothetical protein
MPVIINGTTGVTFPNGVTMSDGTSAPVTAAQGGTGLSSVGTAGNVLTSNGTSWVSQAAAAFDSGTRIGFQQTAAPTGWTKDTTAGLDNSAMRIVTGSVVNGGSVNFTTAFASQTPTGSVSITSVTGSAGATTLSTPQIPSHNHNVNRGGGGAGVNFSTFTGNFNPVFDGPTTSTGGGGSHDHPFSFSSGSGTFTGNAINLAVKYYDFIIASKN